MLFGGVRNAARNSASRVATISDVAAPAQVAPSASKPCSFTTSMVAASISRARNAAISAARSGRSLRSGATLASHVAPERRGRGLIELECVEAIAAILHHHDAVLGARRLERDIAVAHIIDDARG